MSSPRSRVCRLDSGLHPQVLLDLYDAVPHWVSCHQHHRSMVTCTQEAVAAAEQEGEASGLKGRELTKHLRSLLTAAGKQRARRF